MEAQAKLKAMQLAEAEARAREEAERERRMEEENRAAQEEYKRKVEAVLMERVSNILEKNWGKAEVGQVLGTLHAEDERVRPLLRSIDELR